MPAKTLLVQKCFQRTIASRGLCNRRRTTWSKKCDTSPRQSICGRVLGIVRFLLAAYDCRIDLQVPL